ncbi:uncharacterized protein LOC118349869 [Juglans regia]|uniref:Uncharacterized protein LOC118349869 n=1 Tax=Juglans regia TaxID=51240 RepID=A0A6P9F723_JUGRE|nr:uncharacterized protein LOC118349869 [Juglans regia]
MDEVVVTVYQVWKRRNKLVFEEGFWSSEAVVKLVKQLVSEFKETNLKPAVGSALITTRECKWKAPPLNFIKANWDAAVDNIHCRISIGVVLRNSSGHIIASLRSQMDSFPDTHLAKTIAALKALILCQQLDLTHIILERDAQQVVKDIQSSHEIWTSVGMIVRDIKALLTKMSRWFINFIPRTCNFLAHNLARDALKLSEESITLEGLPLCIHHM